MVLLLEVIYDLCVLPKASRTNIQALTPTLGSLISVSVIWAILSISEVKFDTFHSFFTNNCVYNKRISWEKYHLHAKHIDMLIKEPRVLLITTVVSELCLHACLHPACALHDITCVDCRLCCYAVRKFLTHV